MSQDNFENSVDQKYQLKIIREFEISNNMLFEMFTKQNHLMEWFGTPELSIDYYEGELEVGKNYKIGMRSRKTGSKLIYSGSYKEIQRPDRLVFTMFTILPDGTRTGETIIKISLKKVGNKTRMEFIQSGFNTIEIRDKSQISWEYEFDTMERVFDIN